MNREILFRGKLEYNGKWIYGDLLQYENGDVAIFGEKLSSFGCECTEMSKRDRVIPDTIGQYTGLKDKDGNKIFEGDILEYIGKRKDNMNKVYRRKVVFHEGMFALLSKELQAYSALKHHYMEDGRFVWSVIGNIHDNPELIK
nr:MAG TPA: YopX protein [Caudoviricetes sp.]